MPGPGTSPHRKLGAHPILGTCGARGSQGKPSSGSPRTQESALPPTPNIPRHYYLNLFLQEHRIGTEPRDGEVGREATPGSRGRLNTCLIPLEFKVLFILFLIFPNLINMTQSQD